MNYVHAIVLLDHHKAQILRFNADEYEAQKVKEHSHNTHQHSSEVRTIHEFFKSVCEALADMDEILITGTSTAQSDFKHYVEKHSPALAKHIVAYESVDQPTEPQLLAHGRAFFAKYERLAH